MHHTATHPRLVIIRRVVLPTKAIVRPAIAATALPLGRRLFLLSGLPLLPEKGGMRR